MLSESSALAGGGGGRGGGGRRSRGGTEASVVSGRRGGRGGRARAPLSSPAARTPFRGSPSARPAGVWRYFAFRNTDRAALPTPGLPRKVLRGGLCLDLASFAANLPLRRWAERCPHADKRSKAPRSWAAEGQPPPRQLFAPRKRAPTARRGRSGGPWKLVLQTRSWGHTGAPFTDLCGEVGFSHWWVSSNCKMRGNFVNLSPTSPRTQV